MTKKAKAQQEINREKLDKMRAEIYAKGTPTKQDAQALNQAEQRMKTEERNSSMAGILGVQSVEGMDLDHKAAVRANKGKKVQMDKAEAQAMTKAQRDLANQEAASGIFMDRAAELPSPSRLGHFLRTFGQSDREVIQNASSEFTVPQALALLNGPVVEASNSAYSDFQQALQRAATPVEKIELTYLALLSRKPSPEETAIFQEVIRERGDAAARDVLHSLLLGGQFLFVQ